jgi:flagella synthesis protein FlgN
MLTEEIRAVEEFAGVLKKEEEALVAANLDILMPLTEQKGQLATRLHAILERRETALKAAGMPPGREGMAQWIAAADKTGQSGKIWARLLDLAAQAKTQNELNGKLIALHFQHNQRALATLIAAADKAMTYDASGLQKGGGTGRLLGSA